LIDEAAKITSLLAYIVKNWLPHKNSTPVATLLSKFTL